MNQEEKYPRWFVYSYLTYAGATKMEQCLFSWAKKYLYCLIAEDLLDYVIEKIQSKQEEIWNENKRLKKVNVSITLNDRRLKDGFATIYIGGQALYLRKVNDELE